ncbi:MAG: cytochrome c [Gammaproteobacteria bacterium]|nr:cytochrome c [Gammaproteobacteria bacterium]
MTRYLLMTYFLMTFGPWKASAAEVDIEAGRLIYQSSCANVCHQAPRAGRLRPKQWEVVLKTMQTRMQSAGMPALSDLQRQQVLAYLTREEES